MHCHTLQEDPFRLFYACMNVFPRSLVDAHCAIAWALIATTGIVQTGVCVCVAV